MRTYPRAISADSFSDAAEDTVSPGQSVKVSVLYHSVELDVLDWLDVYKAATGKSSADCPDASDGDYLKWVQQKLNTMGYLAGPLTGAKDPQTSRALKRYGRALAGQEIDDETQHGILVGIKAGTKARTDFIETRAALLDRRRSTRVLLDHDYFANEPNARDTLPAPPGEANKPDGHAAMEAAKLDRFELPLKVVIRLVSKRDRTGQRQGVLVPEAVGPVKVEWHVFDPPEDMGVIAARFTGLAEEDRTQSPAYLAKAQKAVAKGDVKDPLRAYDNCPVANGGVRPDDKDDMTPYFRPNGLAGVYADATSGKKFLTTARTVPGGNAALQGLLGTTGALFWGSYIAGDNWAVQARLSLEGVDGADDIKGLHTRLAGLAKAWDKYEPTDPLVAQTGEMTLWRRQHVLAVVDWWSNRSAPPIEWDILVDAFRAAHIELVRPAGGVQTVATLVNTPLLQNAYKDEILRVANLINKGFYQNQTQFLQDNADRVRSFEWRSDAIIPLKFPVRAQQKGETFDTYKFVMQGKSIIAHFTGAVLPLHRVAAEFVRTWLGGDPCGQVIVRFDHLPEADLKNNLNAKDLALFQQNKLADAHIPNYKTDPRGDGGPSFGATGGVAMLEHRHVNQFNSAFLVAHEMGHNYYLSHAAGTPADHDTDDPNCAMFYPSETTLGPKGWGRKTDAGTPIPLFCGKCLLKLRGWKVRTGVPAGSK